VTKLQRTSLAATYLGVDVLLVILGAGASRDSVPGAGDDEAPPLAADLLGDRFFAFFNKFKGSGAAANRVRSGVANGGNLEEELQKLRDQALAGYDPLKVQLLALQMFLQDVWYGLSVSWGERDGGMNNLATLVAALEQWRAQTNSEEILYVTFNYDTLLEQALERELGKSFEAVERYLDADRAVVKVHGSCNWKRELDQPSVPSGMGMEDYDQLIKLAPAMQPSERYHVIARTAQVLLGSVLLAPAVSIPIVNKAGPEEFSCPPDHLARMRDGMARVTDMLVIGWKGNEAHFLKELRDRVPHGARIAIVGRPFSKDEAMLKYPKQAVATCRSMNVKWLSAAALRGQCRVYRTGFTGFVRYHLRDWLASVTP
jgi:hypothetical protein